MKFPCLVVICGGNDEAGDLIAQLPFGGFIAPNIYYMGRAGIIDYKGMRISGYGGVFAISDFGRNVYERVPLVEEKDVKSSIHVRAFSGLQLYLYSVFEQDIFSKQPDFLMSHDWPRYMPPVFKNALSKVRQCLVERVDREGIPFGLKLIDGVQPKNVVCAHHHTKFEFQLSRDYGKVNFTALNRPDYNECEWYEFISAKASRPVSEELSFAPEWIAILQETKEFVKDPESIKVWDTWDDVKKSKADALKHAYVKIKKLNMVVPPFKEDPSEITKEICERFNLEVPM